MDLSVCANVEHLQQLADSNANTSAKAISALLILLVPFHASQGHFSPHHVLQTKIIEMKTLQDVKKNRKKNNLLRLIMPHNSILINN